MQPEIAIYYCRPSQLGDAELARLETYLDHTELARVERISHKKSRLNYTIAQAMLRALLSVRFEQIEPAEWRFCRGEHGKPYLDNATLNSDISIEFNLTHTDDFIGCIISTVGECGIDVEKIHARGQMPSIARRMFHVSECAELEKHTGEAYKVQFLRYWTIREAYGKALGKGLVFDPSNIEIQSFKRLSGERLDVQTSVAAQWHCYLEPVEQYQLAWVVAQSTVLESLQYALIPWSFNSIS